MARKAVFHDTVSGDYDDGSPIDLYDIPDPAGGSDGDVVQVLTGDYVLAPAPGGGAVSSVFGRTGAVVAVTGDYAGVVSAFLTGATQASRYVGATASGAPGSGSFLKGDFVIAQDGKVYVCTAAGSPGTWADVAAGAAVGYATPAVALGSAAAGGAAATVIRSDSTIAAFDTTVPSTQAFGDAAAIGVAAFAARRDHKHAMPSGIGLPELVFKYTVVGSVKASIDTGVDTPDAGTNDWTNGDLLEVYFYARTNEAVASSIVNVTVNNDTGNNYDRESLSGANATAAAAPSLAQARWQVNVDGTSHQANGFGVVTIEIPNYTGTVGFKTAKGTQNLPDSTAGNNLVHAMALQWRSTAAITRLKVICNTGASSFAIGTQLLIYKRRSA